MLVDGEDGNSSDNYADINDIDDNHDKTVVKPGVIAMVVIVIVLLTLFILDDYDRVVHTTIMIDAFNDNQFYLIKGINEMPALLL